MVTYSRGYKFKFYLNARHMMKINNMESKIHPHTWELVMYIDKKSDIFIPFTDIENYIQKILSVYEGKFINEIPPFDTIVPSMENMCEVFSLKLRELLDNQGWEFERLEISENPSRTYFVFNSTKNIETTYNANNDSAFGSSILLDNGTGKYLGDYAEVAASIEQPADQFIKAGNKTKDVVKNNQSSSNSKEEDKSKKKKKSKPAKEEGNKQKEKPKMSNFHFILLSILIIIVASLVTLWWMTREGSYPWGSDSWGHLFKAESLYNDVSKGNIFPIYTELWYNGMQPFRYWGPVTYYIFVIFEFMAKGNIFTAYNMFLIFVFVFGAFSWILWGIKAKRRWLGLVISLLWLFLPENLSILIAAGNFPRYIVSSMFPYLFYVAWCYLEERNKKAAVIIPLWIGLMTVTHLMITAMSLVSLFMFAFIYMLINKKFRETMELLGMSFVGILIAGLWIYPALKGGMMSIDQTQMIHMLTYNLSESLNPFYRFTNLESFYFGLSILLASIFGILFAEKRSKIGFGITILIFLGTTKALVPLLIKMPLSQLFWMVRFTPMAMALFFFGMLMWKKLRKEVLIVIMLLVSIDCALSFKALGHAAQFPEELKGVMDIAIESATQRVAVLDASEFGGFPSYYLSYNEKGKTTQQVFGWAYQGAVTAPNIVCINTALEKGFYPFLFDRCLELGSDTLVVKKNKLKYNVEFIQKASQFGYKLIHQTDRALVLKYSVNGKFGTQVQYEGLGIGKFANNMAYIFPKFEIAKSLFLDDYTEEQLSKYKVIFLSGFKYKNKTSAESLVKKLSEKGVKVIVDLTGVEQDLYSSRASFLQVISEPVTFIDSYPEFKVYNSNHILQKNMPQEYDEWRTMYLENLDKVDGSAVFENQNLSFIGTKINSNIVFIGFNLPFFALETGDNGAIEILEKVIGMKANSLPERQVVGVDVRVENGNILIQSSESKTITGLAYLDSFNISKESYEQVHNLILMNGKELKFSFSYPYFNEGLILSVIGVLSFILITASNILLTIPVRLKMFILKVSEGS